MPNRVEGKSVEELLDELTGPQVGSVAHEQIKAAIQVRVAELQREAARLPGLGEAHRTCYRCRHGDRVDRPLSGGFVVRESGNVTFSE